MFRGGGILQSREEQEENIWTRTPACIGWWERVFSRDEDGQYLNCTLSLFRVPYDVKCERWEYV